jgi:peptidoglycan/xylan/chitin deacetylase (PgdA/CDA1 family)
LLAGVTMLVSAKPAVAVPAPFVWPHGAQAAVSLTYDDGLDSQLDYGLPQLQATGFKATFFLVQENMEARLSDWQKVAELGHEIGDHTENHPCKLGTFSAERFQRTQIAPTERFLNANFGQSGQRPYAYPCGYIGLGRGEARRTSVSVVTPRFSARRLWLLERQAVLPWTPDQPGPIACTCPALSPPMTRMTRRRASPTFAKRFATGAGQFSCSTTSSPSAWAKATPA